jgi:hypothetical protein
VSYRLKRTLKRLSLQFIVGLKPPNARLATHAGTRIRSLKVTEWTNTPPIYLLSRDHYSYVNAILNFSNFACANLSVRERPEGDFRQAARIVLGRRRHRPYCYVGWNGVWRLAVRYDLYRTAAILQS